MPLSDKIARTAARREAGECQSYPQHAEGAEARKPLRKVTLPCLHLGSPAPPPEGQSVVRRWVNCEAGLGVVCPCACGPRCPSYEPDDPSLL